MTEAAFWDPVLQNAMRTDLIGWSKSNQSAWLFGKWRMRPGVDIKETSSWHKRDELVVIFEVSSAGVPSAPLKDRAS